MYWFFKKLIHFSWRIITLQYCGGFCCEACGFSALWLGIEPTSPVLESKVLTNVLPGRSQGCCLLECYTEWENKDMFPFKTWCKTPGVPIGSGIYFIGILPLFTWQTPSSGSELCKLEWSLLSAGGLLKYWLTHYFCFTVSGGGPKICISNGFQVMLLLILLVWGPCFKNHWSKT